MCGICGAVVLEPVVVSAAIDLLTRVNHRGHGAVGIAIPPRESDTTQARFVAAGLVRDACNTNSPAFRSWCDAVVEQQARAFIGHTRYPTIGPSTLINAQPFQMHHPRFGTFYLAHNGQVPGHEVMRSKLEQQGHRFVSQSDSETLAALIAHTDASSLPEAVAIVMKLVPGAFSVLALDSQYVVAARDRHGFWPLWYGLNSNGIWFASEEGSLDGVIETVKIAAGSVVAVPINRPAIEPINHPILVHHCAFRCWLDIAYLSRPDEGIGNVTVSDVRQALGVQLAIDCPAEGDFVVGVPDSGLDAAQGYSQQSGIRLVRASLIRNRFAPGRSFIIPGETERRDAIRAKQKVSRRLVRGKRVVVIDDTLVRSHTGRVLTTMFREAGAAEVHLRIAAPPIRFPCYYGIDTPNVDELPAHRLTEAQMTTHVGANSLGYLQLSSLQHVLDRFRRGWCNACLTGEYPIPIS